MTKSKPFTFVVGPAAEEHHLHPGAVTPLSRYFERLINGNMLEAQERRVIWDDIEVETFALFSEFVYSGNYKSLNLLKVDHANGDNNNVGKSHEAPAMPEIAKGSKLADEQSTNKPQPRDEKSKFEELIQPVALGCLWVSKGASLFRDAGKSHVDVNTLIQAILKRGSPRSNARSMPMDVHNLGRSLALVKLYILADRYCIEALAKRILSDFHSYLVYHYIKYESIGALARLVRMVFEEITEGDALRDTIVLYSSIVCEACMVHPEWKQLLSDVGDLSAAILQKIACQQST